MMILINYSKKNAEEIREWPSWKLDIWGSVKKQKD